MAGVTPCVMGQPNTDWRIKKLLWFFATCNVLQVHVTVGIPIVFAAPTDTPSPSLRARNVPAIWVRKCLGTYQQATFHKIWSCDEILTKYALLCHDIIDPIMSQFCTSGDNRAVETNANLWPNVIIMLQVRGTWFCFSSYGLCAHKTFVQWVAGNGNCSCSPSDISWYNLILPCSISRSP